MAHVPGQVLFVFTALVFAQVLGGLVVWKAPTRRERNFYLAVIGAVFTYAVASVLATWPTS